MDHAELALNPISQTTGSCPITAAALAKVASVRQSFAYRHRMWFTAVSLIAGLAATWAMKWGSGLGPGIRVGLSLAGWCGLASGAALRIWASTYICGRKSVAVVHTGPYSVCRNPLYWGTFLMVAAFPLILASPALAFAMIPPIALYVFAVVPTEESVMLSRHPQEYQDYCRAVSRWLPRFSAYNHGIPLDGASVGVRRECLRMIWWVSFAAMAQFLAPYC